MNWLKENKFLAALGGGTIVAVVLLYVVGAKGASRYVQAKEDFDAAASDASTFEKLALYPRPENRDGKSKALDEYKQSVESLQAAFEAYRPKEVQNVSPQDFTNSLKAADEEIRKAFDDAEIVVPAAFFVGFENYKTTLARGNATGILGYQLAAIKSIMLALAQSGASELKVLHRPSLPEEDGREFKPAPNDVARPLPLELAFVGPEKSVRAFLSSLNKLEGRFVTIRSLRITNATKTPPRATDAKFDKPAASAGSGAATDVFAGGFVLPGEEPAAGEAKPAEPAAAPPAKPAAADSSRILAQVLGNEEVQVFLRLDVMQFLPSKKLP
jgi:hypothetical protein